MNGDGEKLLSIIYKNIEKNRKHSFKVKLKSGRYRVIEYERVMGIISIVKRKLKSMGLREGDRVALIGENSPEWIIAFLAIVDVNAVPILIDSTLPKSEVERLKDKALVSAVVLSVNIFKSLGGWGKLWNEPVMTLDYNFTVCNENKKIKKYNDTKEKDIICILYSSGTTNTAKGVMITYKSMLLKIEEIQRMMNFTNNDRLLHVIPNNHIWGLSCLLLALYVGSEICFIESNNSEILSEAFKEYKPTIFHCAPRVFDLFKNKIISELSKQGKIFKSLMYAGLKTNEYLISKLNVNLGKYIFRPIHKEFGGKIKDFYSAGMALSKETSEFFYAYGFNLHSGYGLTETHVPVCLNLNIKNSHGTSGTPVENVDVKIANKDNRGIGEIQVKTHTIMKGYFRDDELTKASFTEDGWFKTGDMGYFDNSGNLVITGRLKESIVLGNGKKISPNDIENLYKNISGIKDFAVSGVESKDGTYDEIWAFIVRENNYSEDRVKKEINKRERELESYFKISNICFLDEIPKTSLQKPKRYQLREIAHNNEKKINKTKENKKSLNKEYRNIVYRIKNTIKNISGENIADLNENTRLYEDLSFDSLTMSEFCTAIEEEFQNDITSIIKGNICIKDIANFIYKYDNSKLKNEKFKYPVNRSNLDFGLFKIAGFLSKLLWNFQVSGIENISELQNYILCPNHESHLDGLWIATFLPNNDYKKIVCMAKKEHFGNVFGRRLMKIAGGIPVDRYGNSADAIRNCIIEVERGKILLIHPEGTRTENGELGEFKLGAAEISISSYTPIIPVFIDGAYEIYPKGSKIPHIINKENDNRKYNIYIRFGKPIYPKNTEANKLTLKVKNTIIAMKDNINN